MKVYFVYLHNLEDDLYKKIDGASVLPKTIYQNDESGTWEGLYGFTNDKKRIKEFMRTHNKDYFSVKKNKLTKGEYLGLKKEKLELFIKPQNFIASKDKEIKIMTTNC